MFPVVLPRRRIAEVVAGVATLSGLAVAVHAPVFFGAHFGEQDTARLVNDALLWQKGNLRLFTLSDYRYVVSPGYIWLIRVLLPLCERFQTDIGSVLNGLNLAAAALAVILVYRLLMRFLASSVSWCATLALSFIPAFWQAGLYGFPHLPALVVMLFALLLTSSDSPTSTAARRRAQDLLVVLCLSVTLVLKADLYLTAVALPLLFFRTRRVSASALLHLGALLSAPFVLWLLVVTSLLQDVPNLLSFASQWNNQYAPDPARIGTVDAILSWAFTFGILTLPAAVYGIVRAVASGKWLVGVFISAWLFAPLVFWGSRPLDSARHHLQAVVPAALGVGFALETLPGGTWPRFLAAGSLIAANYWAFPPNDSTTVPSGRLFASAEAIRARVRGYHTFANTFADEVSPCKVVLGTFTNPYVDYAVLVGARRVIEAHRQQRFGVDVRDYIIETPTGRGVSSSAVVTPPDVDRVAAAFRAEGYDVRSLEYVLRDAGQGQDVRTAAANGAFVTPVMDVRPCEARYGLGRKSGR